MVWMSGCLTAVKIGYSFSLSVMNLEICGKIKYEINPNIKLIPTHKSVFIFGTKWTNMERGNVFENGIMLEMV